ncbi:vWA domain-containing protein [Phaeobacter sp. C3_T13_0]|uniref:vWA domain-containing protein n=1 Tax=Phaeobacter cretensis TaxID=3342641 RepID=UPI0039BC90ED
MKFIVPVLIAASTSFFATASVSATSDILFILDGSGSMWGQVEGEAKITTAQTTMRQLMDDVPAEARLGLMTYGTTSKESCEDVKVLNFLGADREELKASIGGLKPLGKTPIERSLQKALAVLVATEPTDVPKSMVLVSDGIETCDGDPCLTARISQTMGIDLKIHVVGFDVDAEAREQLECIANAGKGQYFDASNTQGLKSALQEAVVLAQTTAEPEPEVAPEPTGPVITEFFRDDFDGDDLGDQWILTNPDPESYIVEDGALLMLSTSVSPFYDETGSNLITYTGEMPDGDWDATITFTGEMSATGNVLNFGVRKDTKNAMASAFHAANYTSCFATYAYMEKMSKGKIELERAAHRNSSNAHCWRSPFGNETRDTIVAGHEDMPSKLTLSKRGRSYFTTFEMEGLSLEDGSPYVVETDQFTALRMSGDLSFSIGRFHPRKHSKPGGEALFLIDSVVINAVEE